MSRVRPRGRGDVDDELELAPLVVGRDGVALLDAREPALRADGQALGRDDLRRLLDPAQDVVLALELGGLRAHEAQDRGRARREVPQRLEAAGALAVVLEEERVDGEAAE